ncbi:MAG: hypothetical protein EAZ76_10565 [Nostocales cyanobacterium]|nr:MAG: hypothetical protein EAZ87_12390 [Nostocales cyanobacterium]TAF13932.1 MAG: hypothetical protein EAZ76_10565 [Nostocales cyanobacterium]
MKKPSKSFNIKNLTKFKSKLETERDLAKIWEFYMDYFSDHKEFTDLGEPIQNKELEKIVAMITKQMFKQTCNTLFLISIPEYKFIHGGCSVGNSFGGLIYFEDTLQGMIAIPDLPPSTMVKYSRFTGQKLYTDLDKN